MVFKLYLHKLKSAFLASYAVIYVSDSDKLIGLGRALCDGEYQAAIYDMQDIWKRKSEVEKVRENNW